MGFLGKQDFFRRAAAHQRLQHGLDVGIVEAAGELAIRERARAAFAEEHVAFGVQHAGRFKAFHVFGALVHGLSAVDEDGSCAAHGQRQRAEQARRACAHHHGAFAFPLGQREAEHVGRFFHLTGRQEHHLIGLELLRNALFAPGVLQKHVGGEGKMHALFAARVHAALFELHLRDGFFLYMQLLRAQAAKHGFVQLLRHVQPEHQLMHPQHVHPLLWGYCSDMVSQPKNPRNRRKISCT